MLNRLIINAIIAILMLSTSDLLASDYYVNPLCESDCDGTTLVKGWQTLGDVVSASLDDDNTTLWLSGGSSGYTYDNQTLDISHATTTYTLTIRPMSAHPTLSSGYDGLVTISANSGLCIDTSGNNITVNGKKTDACTASDDYGEGCRNIKLTPKSGVWGMRENASGTTQNIVFRYIELDGLQEKNAPDGSSVYGFIVRHCVSGCELDHNYAHDSVIATPDAEEPSGADFYVDGNGSTDYGQILVHHNKVSNSTQNHVSGGPGVDVYNNYFYNDTVYHCDVIHYANTVGIKYFRFWNNLVTHDSQGVFLENNSDPGLPTEHIRIYNNIFTVPAGGGEDDGKFVCFNFNASGTRNDIIISNNTFYGSKSWAVRIPDIAGATWTNSRIENNIFYENALDVSGLVNCSWTPDDNFTFDYNLIYHTAGGVAVKWQTATPGEFESYTSLSSGNWTIDHPTFTHNVVSDPLFISSSNLNLQALSPAINYGNDFSGYYTTDYAGTTRSSWDIGAYEYTGATPNSHRGRITGNLGGNVK